jgi:hypothetical protein
MKAFEVFLNGERLCLAGLAGRCVLTVIIDHVKGKVDPVDDLGLHVGGLISDTDEHVIWSRAQLNTDDEVRVRILESDSADEPTKRVLRDSEEDLEQRKAYVRAVVKQLGWTLTESEDSTGGIDDGSEARTS